MHRVKILDWTLDADPEATRAAHDPMASGSAETCPCDTCPNFVRVRDQAFPPAALELFAQLGIRPDRESEVTGTILEDGLVQYWGWFHFAGTLISGDESRRVASEGRGEGLVGRYEVSQVTHQTLCEGFDIGIVRSRDGAPEGLDGFPVLALEFWTKLPLLDAAPPEGVAG